MYQQLQPSGPPDDHGVVFYKPVVLTVQGPGKYGGFTFNGLDGFWKQARFGYRGSLNAEALTVGQAYLVTLGMKENPGSAPYRDIYECNLPDGQVERYDPQGNMVPGPAGPAVTPEQTADWANNPPGRDYYNEADNPEYDDHIDPPAPPKRDATRESIEKQVFIKEIGAMLGILTANPDSSVFSAEQLDWMRDHWFAGLYELKNGEPLPTPEEETE